MNGLIRLQVHDAGVVGLLPKIIRKVRESEHEFIFSKSISVGVRGQSANLIPRFVKAL